MGKFSSKSGPNQTINLISTQVWVQMDLTIYTLLFQLYFIYLWTLHYTYVLTGWWITASLETIYIVLLLHLMNVYMHYSFYKKWRKSKLGCCRTALGAHALSCKEIFNVVQFLTLLVWVAYDFPYFCCADALVLDRYAIRNVLQGWINSYLTGGVQVFVRGCIDASSFSSLYTITNPFPADESTRDEMSRTGILNYKQECLVFVFQYISTYTSTQAFQYSVSIP